MQVEVIFDIRRTYHGLIVEFVATPFRKLIFDCFCGHYKKDRRKKEVEDLELVEKSNSHIEDIKVS